MASNPLNKNLGATASFHIESSIRELELAGITTLAKQFYAMNSAEAKLKSIDTLGALDSIAKKCEALQQGTIDNLANQLGATASSQMNSIFKEYELIGITSLAKQSSAMKSAEASLKSIGALGAFDSIAKKCEALQQGMIGDLTNRLGATATSHIDSIIREHKLAGVTSLAKHFSAMNSAEASLKSMGALGALDSFAKQYEPMLKTAAVIAKSIDLTEYKANLNFTYFPTEDLCEIDEQEIQQKLENIQNARDRKSLAEQFKALPSWLQFTLLFVLCWVIQPVYNSVIDSYVKHYAECYLPLIPCSSDADDSNRHKHSNRDEIKFIKSLSSENFDYINSRFVSTDYLNIYLKPNQKTQILDELTLGKVVILVEKERNWAKVAYRDDDGKICQGWVHNRYLKKFDK
ncbi:MAG: SH3 domain-containing protein [Nitrosomonas sp.]|nr:SH3 domain-containing protein [Nitrosomonas sp.]